MRKTAVFKFLLSSTIAGIIFFMAVGTIYFKINDQIAPVNEEPVLS